MDRNGNHGLMRRLSPYSRLVVNGIKCNSSRLEGWLALHHQSGLYELFCDDQVNEHYAAPTTGLMYRVWRIRIYFRGVFRQV